MCLAVPGRITALDPDDPLRMGEVDFGGARRSVSLAYLPDARLGDWVVVHAGFAIAAIDEAAALESLDLLRAMGELDAAIGPDLPPGPRR